LAQQACFPVRWGGLALRLEACSRRASLSSPQAGADCRAVDAGRAGGKGIVIWCSRGASIFELSSLMISYYIELGIHKQAEIQELSTGTP